jgi:hypothetical protein
MLGPERGPARVRAHADRASAVAETVLIVAGFAVLLVLLPHTLGSDDKIRFGDIEQLLHHGKLSDSKYSLVMPLVSSPFLLLGELIGSPEGWAARFNVIVVAVGSGVAFGLTRGHADPRVLRKTVLVLLFASLLTERLRDYNAEVLTATLVAVGLLVLATHRSPVIGWGLIVVGVVNIPAALVGLALVSVTETVRTRRLRLVIPLLAATALIMGESWLRRGGPLTTGYGHDHGFQTILPYSGRVGFSYPFVLGVVSILFSFGRGLLFFTPGLVLWFAARTRQLMKNSWHLVVLMLLFVAGLVIVYARWWAWYGGLSWGPRFFVFAAIPASLAIAVRLGHAGESPRADALTLLVLAFSGWVGVSGAVADPHAIDFCSLNQYALESLCWYVPEYSSLWHPVLQFPSLTTSTYLVAAYCTIVFTWLAAPLVASTTRAVVRVRPSPGWIEGWRF